MILTKGIGASVLATIKTFFPEWLTSFKIRIVDYSGIVFDPTASGPPIISRTLPIATKLEQINALALNGTSALAAGSCRSEQVETKDTSSSSSGGGGGGGGGDGDGSSSSSNSGDCDGSTKISVILIDDSFESELSSTLDPELLCRCGSSNWPFYRASYEGVIQMVIGGPSRNGDGIQPSDLEDILRIASMLRK